MTIRFSPRRVRSFRASLSLLAILSLLLGQVSVAAAPAVDMDPPQSPLRGGKTDRAGDIDPPRSPLRGGKVDPALADGGEVRPSPLWGELEGAGTTLTETSAVTLTVTPAATDIVTDTLAPTATSTPIATETPTVTATATLTPTLTPEPLPLLSLSKRADPAAASPGEVVTFTLVASNTGKTAALDLLLRDPVPDGLQYLPGSAAEADYDAASGVVAWQLKALEPGQAVTLSLAAQVTATAGQELANVASLSAADAAQAVTATAVVEIKEPEEADWTRIGPEKGGKLVSADGQVEVEFPAGAVDLPVEVSHRPLEPQELPAGQRIFYRFELNARQTDRPDQAVTTFSKPLTVTLVYSDAQVAGLMEEGLRLVTWDERQEVWEPVSTTVDTKANVLTARVSHFSVLAGEGEDDVYFLPRLEAGQVSLFTGDSSYSYELEVPAGAGGLKVPLTLRYSGSIPNGLQQPLIGPDYGGDTGWVGVGWTLEIGKIEDGVLTMDGLSGEMEMMVPHIGTDVLEEQCDWDDTHCGWGWWVTRRHRLQDEQFAYITSTRWNSCQTGEACGNHAPPSVSNRIENMGQFDLWTKDGTHYIFGSQEFVPDHPERLDWGGPGSRLDVTAGDGRRVYEVYLLDTIIDPHGNRVEIEWKVHPKQVSDEWQLKEAYPQHIRYTKNANAGDSILEYDVEFEVSTKDFDVKCPDLEHDNCRSLAFTGGLLNAINVKYGSELMRRYDFDYLNRDAPQYYLLDSITEQDYNETALPATDFVYDEDLEIGWRTNDEPMRTVERPFLSAVNNNYGGHLSFAYEPYCLRTGNCGEETLGKRQQVDTKSLRAEGDNPAISFDYHYSDPGYVLNDPADPSEGLKEFIGFQWVTEDANGLRYTNNEFYNTMYADSGQPVGHPKDPRKGKLLWTKSGKLTTSGWQEYSETAYDYEDYADDPSSDLPNGIHFVYTSQVTESTCQGSSCQSKKTVYRYDTTWQNCGVANSTQYGNVTHVEEYESGTASTPYRTTRKGYCPNTTAWIVDRVAVKNVYAGDTLDSSHLQSSTWYVYSDNEVNPTANWDQVPGSKGELRGVRRWKQWSPSYQLVDTRYWHDNFGNVTDETVYNNYGTSTTAWASGNARTTTTAYDAHGIFALTVTQPAVGSYTPQETRQYYGVDNVSSDVGSGGFPGMLKSVTDVNNGDTTSYRYDTFGRVKKEVRPYDSTDLPTVEYTYDDSYLSGSVHYPKVTETVREQSGVGSATQVNFEYYDGLGRLVETLAERTNGGEQVLSYRTYDALGQVQAEYVPYVVSGSFSDFKALATPEPAHTTYSYDALGRTTKVTNPDGTSTETAYHGWASTTGEANGRFQTQHPDAFGRLVQVGETAIEREDLFSSLDGNTWSYNSYQSLEDGAVKNAGTGSSYDANFYRTAYAIDGGADGWGSQVEFKVNGTETWAHFSLEASGSPSRRLGVVARNNKISVQYNLGSGLVYPVDLVNPMTLSAWYVVQIRVTDEGKARIQVWRRDGTGEGGVYTFDMPEGLTYRFHHWIYRDTAWLDNYRELGDQVTSYQYDEMDNLKHVIDAANNVTTMNYDPLGRKTSMTDPDMGTWAYGYDPVGNLTSQDDPQNAATTFTYRCDCMSSQGM